jgi:hypothetical protein
MLDGERFHERVKGMMGDVELFEVLGVMDIW